MSEQPKVIIKVENLVKKYGQFAAVNDVSFQVYEGEIFGLLGPNGAGKTTVMEIIETLRNKTAGTVTVFDRNVETSSNEIKELIGVQLQQSGFYPSLTLTETLSLFNDLYNANVSPKELLERVGLSHKAMAKFNDLSGGQKQRFSIATTLVNQPKIIFLDEPSTGLDPKARRNLWHLIEDIRSKGTTIVLTTHYMDEAENLCDRVGVMDQGKIIAMDAPGVLIDQLIARGFTRPKQVKLATLEDVFLDLTGKNLVPGEEGEDDE